MIDQWGEFIDEIPSEEGVFDETSLGCSGSLGCSDSLCAFPEVEQRNVIDTSQPLFTRSLGDNRVEIYSGSPIRAATAGLGSDDPSRIEQITGAVTSGIDSATNLAGGILSMIGDYRDREASRLAASRELDARMDVLNAELAQLSSGSQEAAELRAMIAEMQAAQTSDNTDAMLQAIAASQQPAIPSWALIGGGIAALAITGLLVYSIASK